MSAVATNVAVERWADVRRLPTAFEAFDEPLPQMAAGKRGKTGYLHYVASKAAVYGMTHAMARELGPDNIRVNTLSPGFTTTEVPRSTFTQAQLDGIMNSQVLKRLADTGDMVGVAAFLMSDDSRWMTGQTFHVTGGLLFR